MSRGIDTTEVITAERAHELNAQGYGFVARYLDRISGGNLTRTEARAISAAGLFIVSTAERGNPTSEEYFTYERGREDAVIALARAIACGQPRGTPIYPTVDCDVTPDRPEQYFRGWRDGIGRGPEGSLVYAVGVYGSGLVCGALHSLGLVSYTWLAMPQGWADYWEWRGKANIVQTGSRGNADFDVSQGNELPKGGGGGWRLG